MSTLELFLNNEEDTIAFGKELACAIAIDRVPNKQATELSGNSGLEIMGAIIYLVGDLGAGKTTLTRGVMRGFGYEGAVKSPTYTIIEPYEFEKSKIYHFDLYRLSYAEEVEYLGAEEYFLSANLCLIEWPERGLGSIPPADLVIELTQSGIGRSVNCIEQSKKGSKIIKRLTEKGRNL